MKSVFRISVLVLLALTVVLYASDKNTKEQPQPKLEFIGGDTYDWGLVSPKDNPLKASVIIKNTGNAKLKITRVKPACGCTTAPLTKTELEPGDTTTMNVTLRINSRGGKVHKTIRIASNDPKNPNLIYHLKCKVFMPLELKPTPYFPFSTMKVGSEAVSTVTLTNNTKKTVTFSDIEFEPKDLVFNIKDGEKIKPGQTIDLVIKYRPKKTGYFNCWVKMKTTCKDMPNIYIPGYGNVQESSIFNN